MDDQQEAHLSHIYSEFFLLTGKKYRKGAEEHGGKLEDYTSLELVNMAIEEAIDQFTYLITLRDKLLKEADNREDEILEAKSRDEL